MPDAVDRNARAADLNYVGSYLKLVAHVKGAAARSFGAVTAFATGLPLGLFNGCLVVARARAEDLGDALDWLATRDVPHRVWIREELAPDLSDVPQARGFEREARLYPGMVLHSVPAPPPAAGVTIRPVEDRRSLDEHLGILVEQGMTRDIAERLFPETFALDPAVRLFTASLHGRPVGTSVALRTGKVSGVYAVGTHPDARHRGVGTAATWAAAEAGRSWGCDRVVLQSSEMGESMYAAMGFRTVVRYATFRRPVGSS